MRQRRVRRVRHVAAVVGVGLLLAVAAAGGASAASYHVSGGLSLGGGFGLHAAVWIHPFLMDNVTGRIGGEYWGWLGCNYVGADASGLYRVEMARYAPDLAARFPSVRPYAGAGTSVGQWGCGTWRWTRVDLYGTAGAEYDLSSNLWAWGELRLHAIRFHFGEWWQGWAGDPLVTTAAGVGFRF